MAGLTLQQALSLYASSNPFATAEARRTSNYSGYVDGGLVRLLDWKEPAPQAKLAHAALRGFLQSDRFSCVAGKAAILSGAYRFGYYSDFPGRAATAGLARDLAAFVRERPFMSPRYATFVAVFERAASTGERGFEADLWEQLQLLHELDVRYHDWDPTASSDAGDPNFAFSFAGSAFFVVGMHPESSRLSRRFFLPALAFNLHDQFKLARNDGNYVRIQTLVRARDLELQGTLNPELREFGAASEARQYSGRQAEAQWKCPFTARS